MHYTVQLPIRNFISLLETNRVRKLIKHSLVLKTMPFVDY